MRKNRKSDAPYVYNDREAEIVAAIKYSRCPLCFLAHPDAHLLPTQQQNELFKSIRIILGLRLKILSVILELLHDKGVVGNRQFYALKSLKKST